MLGFLAETNFRRALVMSNGGYGAFWGNPISASLLALSCAFIAYPLVMRVYGRLTKGQAV